jgi:outer membrane protein TolC
MSDYFTRSGVLCALLLASSWTWVVPRAEAQQVASADTVADSGGGQTLTLREALLRASRSAPQVLAAFANADAARAQLRVASAALYPTVSASVGASVGVANGGAGSTTTAGRSSVSASASATAALNANWLLWDFGRTAASRDIASGNVAIAEAGSASVQQAAVQSAASAFYGVLADESVVAAARTSIEQLTAQRDVAAGFVEIGSQPPIAGVRAEVALASAELELRVAEGAWRSDIATLGAALALDPALPLRVVAPAPLQVSYGVEQAIVAALATRPDVRAERARVATVEAQLRGARADYLPTLSASGSLGVRYGLASPGGGAASESASASVGLSVPVFDATIPARVRGAEAQLVAARANLAELELGVRTSAVQAVIAAQSAEIILEQAERVAAGAAANLAQAEGRYAAGAAPQLELLDAQAVDASARITVIRLRAQVELAKIALLAAMGQLPELTRR